MVALGAHPKTLPFYKYNGDLIKLNIGNECAAVVVSLRIFGFWQLLLEILKLRTLYRFRELKPITLWRVRYLRRASDLIAQPVTTIGRRPGVVSGDAYHNIEPHQHSLHTFTLPIFT